MLYFLSHKYLSEYTRCIICILLLLLFYKQNEKFKHLKEDSISSYDDGEVKKVYIAVLLALFIVCIVGVGVACGLVFGLKGNVQLIQ